MFAIIRVYKLNFRTSKDNLNRLFACNRISAQIWNKCLELAKEHYQKTGSWIDRKTFHLATKGQYPIHSQSIQAVYERYLDARENAQKVRALGYTNIRYPYKEKRHFNTKWKKDGFRIDEQGNVRNPFGSRFISFPPAKLKKSNSSIIQHKRVPFVGRERNPLLGITTVRGYVQHRDIHGASNILTKHKYGQYQEIALKKYKYLRIA